MITNVVLVVDRVNDSPNQIRYQRVRALAERYKLTVVCSSPLPKSLRAVVDDEYVVVGWRKLLKKCLDIGKRFNNNGVDYYFHTQYAPRPLMVGYLCKRLLKGKWVYDLWDHPSLTWSREHNYHKLIKIILWKYVFKNKLKAADAWVVGMHPGIISYLPVAPLKCRFIFSGPGILESKKNEKVHLIDDDCEREVGVCFAGHVCQQRGVNIILDWAERYDGPPVKLDLIGQYDNDVYKRINNGILNKSGCKVRVNLHGRILHEEVLQIMSMSDIGLCLVDPKIINYRYAYPVKVVEYLSQGLVPVATEGHGVRDLIKHGYNGFVSEYNLVSFNEVMHKAISLCADKASRNELVLNGSETIKNRSWNVVNKRLLNEIEDALKDVC